MIRTAVAALLAVPALLVGSALTAGAYAAPSETFLAEVATSGPNGVKIGLTEGTKSAGDLRFTRCATTSPTAFVCSGTGTVIVGGVTYGPARVRVRWACPVHKSCAKRAEGTLKSHGSLLALLHVRTTVAAFQKRGSTFGIDVETVGE